MALALIIAGIILIYLSRQARKVSKQEYEPPYRYDPHNHLLRYCTFCGQQQRRIRTEEENLDPNESAPYWRVEGPMIMPTCACHGDAKMWDDTDPIEW